MRGLMTYSLCLLRSNPLQWVLGDGELDECWACGAHTVVVEMDDGEPCDSAPVLCDLDVGEVEFYMPDEVEVSMGFCHSRLQIGCRVPWMVGRSKLCEGPATAGGA